MKALFIIAILTALYLAVLRDNTNDSIITMIAFCLVVRGIYNYGYSYGHDDGYHQSQMEFAHSQRRGAL